MAVRKLTDVIKPGDWFMFQTRHGNWVVGIASKIEENGDISCPARDEATGIESMFFTTWKAAVNAAAAKGLQRTWKIGYHRWKLEPMQQPV